MKLNQQMKTILPLAAFAGLALTVGSADAATVWNVNVGTEIDSTDNFVGAAAENTVSSTWNSIASSDVTGMALDDSTGDDAAGVTLDFATVRAGGGAIYGTYAAGGLEIFDTYAGAGGVTVDFTLKGLDNSATYDLIIYSDWKWGNRNYPVEQTTGSGLSGTYTINSTGPGSLVEDTDSGAGADHGNWVRITGLTADGGELAFTGANGADAAFSGFQLINTVPEPTTTALLGLGGLALILRRRK
jgi:hypothetical protein